MPLLKAESTLLALQTPLQLTERAGRRGEDREGSWECTLEAPLCPCWAWHWAGCREAVMSHLFCFPSSHLHSQSGVSLPPHHSGDMCLLMVAEVCRLRPVSADGPFEPYVHPGSVTSGRRVAHGLGSPGHVPAVSTQYVRSLQLGSISMGRGSAPQGVCYQRKAGGPGHCRP